MRLLASFCLALSVSACGFVGFPGVYKIDVEQGNIVTPEMVGQLKPGMSRRQVRFILGTPLLEDPFNPDRWDYPYIKRNGQTVLSESRLMVYFDGDNLSKYETDLSEEVLSQELDSEQPEG
ncbi:MAG: outer membrane protein assembly factor BamE [Pseudomonadota bacterium]